MKTIKYILKGILLYATIILSVLFIASVDSILDKGYYLYAIFIIASLIYTCYKTITRKELDILLGNKLLGISYDNE